MSTKAEEVSTQALSPESTLGTALAASAGVVEVAGASSAPRNTEATPETESITATNKIDRAILAGLIAPFPLSNEKRDTQGIRKSATASQVVCHNGFSK
jgi:hypothetical protein